MMSDKQYKTARKAIELDLKQSKAPWMHNYLRETEKCAQKTRI